MPNIGKPIPDRVAQRALERFTRDPASGCHVSRYSVASHGYAQIGWQADGRTHGTTAHRAAWTAMHGPIPAGMTVDHLCKNRQCVNVEHLRLLPNFENARRTAGRDWELGFCAQGHPNTEIILKAGKRVCQICSRVWQSRYRERKALRTQREAA